MHLKTKKEAWIPREILSASMLLYFVLLKELLLLQLYSQLQAIILF